MSHIKINILVFILLYHHASTFVVKNRDVAHAMAKYPVCHPGRNARPFQLIFIALIFLWVFLKNPVRRAMSGFTEQALPGHPCVYSGLFWIHPYVKSELNKINLLNWGKKPTGDHLGQRSGSAEQTSACRVPWPHGWMLLLFCRGLAFHVRHQIQILHLSVCLWYYHHLSPCEWDRLGFSGH